MQIIRLGNERLDAVFELVQQTIAKTYPDYYPDEAVDFFIRHHSAATILADIQAGTVYGVDMHGTVGGTVAVDGCEIKRMFVFPTLHGHGLGAGLMAHAESLVASEHPFAQLDASIPGYSFYFKLGYRTFECRKIHLENGRKLVYQMMRKKLR